MLLRAARPSSAIGRVARRHLACEAVVRCAPGKALRTAALYSRGFVDHARSGSEGLMEEKGALRNMSRTSVDDERACPECGSDHLVHDYSRGELVCAACGLVLTERAIDQGPEWAAHSIEEAERLARTGPPRKPLTGASGLTTVLPFPTRDIRGKRIPERDRVTFYRLRKLQIRSGSSRRGERGLQDAVRNLNRIGSHMGVPNVVKEEAGFICRKAIESGYARGRSLTRLIAAAVYAACRICGVPRTLGEMERVTDVPRKTIAKDYRGLVRARAVRAAPLPRPQDYVSRFCTELGLSHRVEANALRILERLETRGSLRSLSPVGTTAVAIYVAARSCGEPRFQTEIARVSGVSEVTLRSRLRILGGSEEGPGGRGRAAPKPSMRAFQFP